MAWWAILHRGEDPRVRAAWGDREVLHQRLGAPVGGNAETTYGGLPGEYVESVLNGLNSAATGNMSPGAVRVSESVHGLAGLRGAPLSLGSFVLT